MRSILLTSAGICGVKKSDVQRWNAIDRSRAKVEANAAREKVVVVGEAANQQQVEGVTIAVRHIAEGAEDRVRER